MQIIFSHELNRMQELPLIRLPTQVAREELVSKHISPQNSQLCYCIFIFFCSIQVPLLDLIGHDASVYYAYTEVTFWESHNSFIQVSKFIKSR